MLRFIFLMWAMACSVPSVWGQIGGKTVYEFLRTPHSARLAALGGYQISVRDGDIAMAYQNPAVLNRLSHHQIGFQQSAYLGNIGHGYLGYGYHLPTKTPLTMHAGIQYISYGKMPLTLPDGTTAGEFRASEYALNVGAAYQPNERFSVGANFKTVLSYLESYNSTGWAMDIGALYEDTSKNIAVALTLRNAGSQFTTYNRDHRMEPLPLDLQLGFTHRLKYLPLRLGIVAHHLHRWNILYDDPNQQQNQSLLGNQAPKNNKAAKFFDNFFRHFIFNFEFLIGKRGREFLFLRFAYNHYRRGELSVKGIVGMSGFSGGLGVRIRNFRIDYGIASYHVAGAAHYFGLSMDIKPFLKSNKTE